MRRAYLPAGRVGLAAVVAMAVLGRLLWGFAVEARRLRVERHIARIPDLPVDLDGKTIAVISDIHAGMPLGNEAVAARAIQKILNERPAAVLLAGDFVRHPTGDATGRTAVVTSLLRPLPAAGIPTFAVLGNHDYDHASDARRSVALEDQISSALRDAGITVLRNESIPLRSPGSAGALWIVGLGEHREGDDRPTVAFRNVPPDAPRIVVMHNPDSFPLLAPGAAPFAVAGHTHGAQVRFRKQTPVPLWMRLMRMPRDLRRGSGWIDGHGAPDNRLYITRGIGFSGAPLRINATPEVTFFKLRRTPPFRPRSSPGWPWRGESRG